MSFPIRNDEVGTPSLTSPGENPGRPSFKCILCGKRFTQNQVLLRHLREQHQPRFKCSRPNCDYKRTQSRASEYRKHLRKMHGLENDEIDKILAQPPRLKAIESDLPLSPPLIDVHRASTLLLPLVACNLRPGDGGPRVTTEGGIEHLAATHAPSRLLSEEESALVRRHFKIYGQFRFPSGNPSTANPGIHVPAPPAQQPEPDTQESWFSSDILAPQALYPHALKETIPIVAGCHPNARA